MNEMKLLNPPSRINVFLMQPFTVFFATLVFNFLFFTLFAFILTHISFPAKPFDWLSYNGFILGIIVYVVAVALALAAWSSSEEYGWGREVREGFSSGTTFRDYHTVNEWIRQHPEVQPYVNAVKAQGRPLYLGDMLRLERWVGDVQSQSETYSV